MNLPLFALSALRRHWKLIGLALLLAAIGVQQLRVVGLKSSISAEKAGRALDRSNYEKAQAQAAVDAYAAKIKKEAEDAKKAEAADARYADLSGQYRAAVLRYQAAQRAAGKADLPKSSQASSGPNSPGGAPIIPLGSILIPEADALICATNQGRLEAAHEWALSL